MFPLTRADRIIRGMSFDLTLTDDEHGALVRLLRKAIDEERFPFAPRWGPDQSHFGEARTAGAETASTRALATRHGTVAGQGRRKR